MKRFLKKHIVEILLTVALVAGLCIMLYPTVSNWWNTLHQTRAIATYVETVENTTAEERAAMLAAAQAYNASLAGHDAAFLLDEEQQAEYENLLNVSGTGIMGYINIPNIDVNLPIYHGTSEEVLQVGVGHLAGSSLPVGGEGSHCLLSGHRGLPSAKLFTDLNQLQPGDLFLLNVLDETLTYQVDQVRIILPEELGDLAMVAGMDYCTLITCTPYGINTHRMLVRGHRVENQQAAILHVTADASRISTAYVIPAIAVPLLLITTLLLVAFGGRKPKKSHQQLLEDLKKM